jgi:hypothetical protein
MHVLAALQGLVNRQAPRLFIFYCSEFGVETDQFWWEWLRGEDGWLREARVQSMDKLEDVVKAFAAAYSGLVVYDAKVPATSNLASTAAGCEGLLPVRWDSAPDSVCQLLTQGLKLPVKLWLIHPDGSPKFTGQGRIPDTNEPSTGSAKNDAYRWAMARHLRPGRCGPRVAAYNLDAFWLQHPRSAGPEMHTLCNQDYYVARRAFFFDLSPWGDENPRDDLNQPRGADYATLLAVLRALYDQAGAQMIQVGGFIPWPFKYTRHSTPTSQHADVPTEWEFARLLSQFNCYLEADAAGLGALANASFYQHYPLRSRYPQPNPRPGPAQWRARGLVDASGQVSPRLYLGHYVGDYDAPSWLAKAVAAFFADPTRGQVPLGWAFNPNLADRVPHVLAYAYRRASSNDFFIAGDSGAGYVNARALTVRPDSGLPSGLWAWEKHCQGYYHRWGMTVTGFVLDGAAGAATETEFQAYRSFSPDGLGTHFERGPALRAGLPTCPEKDLPDGVEAAAAFIAAQAARGQGRPAFLWARSILKPPRWYADLSRTLRERHPTVPFEVVDPYTFFGLVRLTQRSR